MAQFSIILTRDITESVCISVEADSQENAEAEALAMQDAQEWTQDDNAPQPAYITACEQDADDEPYHGECGQCEGTGTIEGGLSGDGDSEECPVCDGTGTIGGEA